MWLVDADGLAGLVVDEAIPGLLHDRRHPVVTAYSVGVAADHLLGRDAVGLLGEGAHEIDAAARDDPGLEALVAQDRRAAPAWAGRPSRHRAARRVAGGRQPAAHVGLNASTVMPEWDAMTSISPSSPRRPSCLDVAGGAARSVSEVRIDGSASAFSRSRSSAIEKLEVDRLLGPERAVVVEDGDAVGRAARSPARPGR
jgi:hypothetical protein